MFNFLKEIKNKKDEGFTLVELMVALTLFTFITLAMVSSLYAINNSYRKVVAMRGVLDNLNFAVESMSRTIRTSSDITCDGELATSGARNCLFPNNPKSRISMKSTLGREYDVEYRLNTSTKQIEKRIDEGSGYGDWIAITSPEISVEKLSFFVHNSNTSDEAQPYVIMLVSGVATAYTGETTEFALHTLISQRSGK